MAFDYEGAISAGYSPSEIADYLGKQKKFDVAGARKSGYDDYEIITHLTTPEVVTPPAKQKEGFLPGLKEGAIGAYEATKRGVTAPFQSEEAIKAEYEAQKAAEAQRNIAYTPFSAIPEAYEKEGLGAAASTTYQAARDALARSLPYMAPTLGGAATGARIGSFGGPLGTAAGAIIGGIAGSTPMFAGTNIERRIQEKTPGPLVTPEVYKTAAGQAALDTAATMFTLGTGLVAKVVGRPVAQVTEQELMRTAERSLTGTLGRGAGRGAISEMPTEVAQQILERKQAGLSLTSEDAYREYGEAAAAAGVLGGVLGGAGNVVTRSQAQTQLAAVQDERDQKLAEINAERQRIAQIASTAQATEQARLKAIDDELALQAEEAQKAYEAYEASLRVPLTTQAELDLAPETTVEEVAARRAAETPQGDLFAEPVAEKATDVATLTTLDEPTIKSFGFNKNSLAYKALSQLNNPAISAAEKADRFNTIIEKNKEKVKSKEQEEAIDKFSRFLDQYKVKENADELARINLESGTSGVSVPAYDERGPNAAAERVAEGAPPTVDTVRDDVGQPIGGTGSEYAALETAPEAVAPEATEVIAEPEQEARITPEERQQRIIEQRAEAEAARRAEREANLAAAKAEQAPYRAAEMTEAELEGLRAAKEFEEAPTDVDYSQRMDRGVGTTPANIEAAMQDWYIDPAAGKQAAQIVNNVNELPQNVARVIEQKARERGIDKGAIQAFTHNGTAYLIADRIKPGTERSVFMHEVGAHLGLKTSEVNSIANKINKWANAAPESVERQVYDAVQRRMDQAKEISNEELVAYTVEEAANLGITPEAVLRAKAAPPNTVAGIIQYLAEKVMQSAKAAFNAFTTTPTAQDLIDYVYGSTRKVLQEGPAKVAQEPQLSAADLTGDNIARDLVSPRVADARRNLGAAVSELTPKLLSMYQLVDQFGQSGTDGKFGAALTDYATLTDQMTMTQQRLKNKAHKVLSDWGMFANKNPKENDLLGKLMLDVTRAGIHPDEAIDAEANAHLTEEDKAKYEALSNAYNSLSPEAKEIYQRARAMLQENFQLRSTMYKDMVRGAYAEDLAVATPEETERINAKIDKAIKEHEMLLNAIRGPYFPLMRFGDYLVIAESSELRALRDELKEATGKERQVLAQRIREMEKDDQHYQVVAAEKRSDQYKEANKLKAQGFNVRESKAEEYMGNIRQNSFAAVDQLNKIFDSDIDDAGLEPGQRSALRQAMIDSVLAGMPENSALQRQIRRRNIAGATSNMLQAFAETMERDSHYLSRMGFMKPLSQSLIKMRNESKDDMKLRNVYNNIRARINMDVRYDHHPILSKLTGFSSIYHLGIAPSYLLQNMTQPFAITVPQLAGRYGAGKTSRAVISAWKDSVKAIRGGRDGKFRSLKEADFNKVFEGGELRMVKMLEDLGKLDIANNMDTEVYTKGMSPRMIKFWTVFNWSSHNIELMNRLTTALAAYRLEMQRSNGNEVASAKAARDAVELTQLDYSDTNAAYVMKQGHFGGLNRIPMQFRKYQQGMIYLLARNFKNAWGDDAEAKKAFLYLMGTQLLMAGVRGVPVAAPLLFLLGAFGDKDDKEGSLETQLRNALADSVGPDVARVFWKGLPAMMGVDSGSMSMENLFLPFPMMRSNAITDAATGKDAVTELMFNLGGAPVSMASRLMDSYL